MHWESAQRVPQMLTGLRRVGRSTPAPVLIRGYRSVHLKAHLPPGDGDRVLRSPNGTFFFSEVKHRVKSACSHFKTIKIKVSLLSCLFDTGELPKAADERKLELALLCIQPSALRGLSVFSGFTPSALYSIAFAWVTRELS